ncbi:DUF6011 domain-containing protein [Glycomyces artemisiae]|uniref:Uncharacterized protein n=1 Tax=Glycomyces artemisiae TaxID=1076443 RepID=A0A2T0UEV6_9ACTN|nr:DUF6011 domain-containing protein [Glycomyces artemisiae]PRY56470.1 hypothetical protein B0I28_109119 [Glycomyces artemisiae]
MAERLADGYYAVPDPDNAATMTCWRVKDDGMHPHPAKAWYGPDRPLRKDAPGKPGTDEYIAWMRDYFDTWTAWARRVKDAIAADPVAAQRHFAAKTAHCCVCGRALTDGASKILGIGPDCREKVPNHVLMAHLAATRGEPSD